jgi:aromatic ring-opening dioxygenase catalytic subunit (LigB family)
MSQILGGIGIAHTPSMGYQYDKGIAGDWDPAWRRWFDGPRSAAAWLREKAPTHVIVIYNDHMNYFDLSSYPTFAIGMAERFPQADEAYGLRPFAAVDGDPGFAWPIARALTAAGFDLTFCQELELDHGVYSWLPYLFEQPWPVRMLPIAVNMLMQPLPTPARLCALGGALRAAVAADGADHRIVIIGTGGMSHQIHGTRFGMTNERFDRRFLVRIVDDFDALVALPPDTIMKVAGTEAIELSMWYAMRAALAPAAQAAYSFYTTPSVTGCGVLALDEP